MMLWTAPLCVIGSAIVVTLKQQQFKEAAQRFRDLFLACALLDRCLSVDCDAAVAGNVTATASATNSRVFAPSKFLFWPAELSWI
jgi:hypothetical protein